MNDYDPSSDFDFPAPSIDPHSPERVRAARLMTASKVLKILYTAGAFGLMVVFLLLEETLTHSLWMCLGLIPFIICFFLCGICRRRALMLICTKRTTAHCLYTVRHRSGKSYHRHPVVEFEADGKTYTAELPVSCPRCSEGELYTIYYDPLDPNTIRPE